MVEWKSVKFQFEKQVAVQKMAERQQRELQREMENLDAEIVKATEEIVDLKKELSLGKEKVERQLVYDKMAKEILKIPSRAKSQKYTHFLIDRLIDSIEREIQQSQIELDLLDEILENRKKQFQAFIKNIHDLESILETSKAEEAAELAKRLASTDLVDEQKMDDDEEEEVVEINDQD